MNCLERTWLLPSLGVSLGTASNASYLPSEPVETCSLVDLSDLDLETAVQEMSDLDLQLVAGLEACIVDLDLQGHLALGKDETGFVCTSDEPC